MMQQMQAGGGMPNMGGDFDMSKLAGMDQSASMPAHEGKGGDSDDEDDEMPPLEATS